jgi:epoxyqueuosine reductase
MVEGLAEVLHRLRSKEGLLLAWTPAVPLVEEANELAARLSHGFPADLGLSLERLDDLADPRLRHSWARTVASFALPVPSLPYRGAEPAGTIAPFAAFPWYDLLKEKLGRIRKSLRHAFPALRLRVFVEGGLLEKAWAVRSGLGWRGRNSLVYHPTFGSRILLGEMLFGESLPDGGKPLENRCGECRLCLETCPVGAIEAPFQVRAERCLDYWTLRYPGAFPTPVRPLLGTRLFGCEACQAVCPRNQDLPPIQVPPLQGPGPAIPLAEALNLDETEYRNRFTGHTFARVPFPLFLRNALCAAGNSSDPALTHQIRDFLGHPDPILAEQAGWSMARLTGKE